MDGLTPAEKDLVVSYLTLRQVIGWVGLVMPWVVRFWGAWLLDVPERNSISAYYYTDMHDIFVSTMVLVGALLACFRTPARRDNVVATITGLAAIGIGLFPMDLTFANLPASMREYHGSMSFLKLPSIHFVFAAVFFTLSTYLVGFRFRVFTPKMPTAQKRRRNLAYQICAAVMAVSTVTIAIQAVLAKLHPPSSPREMAGDAAAIFWPETFAVFALAIAWLIKGRGVWWFRGP